MCKSLRLAFVSLLIVVMCALSAMAQSTTTGAIGGVVTNPNKEVVPGATVTVKVRLTRLLLGWPSLTVTVMVATPLLVPCGVKRSVANPFGLA